MKPACMLTVLCAHPCEGTTVVTVSGDLDCYSSALLRAKLIALTKRDRYLVLDLTDVRFMDSAGLSVLVNAWKLAVALGGRLALVVDPRAMQKLRITGLDRVLDVRETVAGAVAGNEAAA